MRQVVDWNAALWAGLISGLVFLLVDILLSAAILGSPWVYLRIIASLILGTAVLPPPATFDLSVFLVAVVIQVLLSLVYAGLLAVIIHRWGLIVGILGGALFGFAIYLINFYTLSFFFPWFYPYRSWIILWGHVLFGALAGGLYEALEVEKFVKE
jgi:hypothetical protein